MSPLGRAAMAMLLKPFVRQRLVMFLARLRSEDLSFIGDLVRDGKVTPVISNRYALSEVPEAVRHLEEGHARGKVVINVVRGDET
jgi:NADPH:quinone reductase-like Zn-dependent oxidoreductase